MLILMMTALSVSKAMQLTELEQGAAAAQVDRLREAEENSQNFDGLVSSQEDDDINKEEFWNLATPLLKDLLAKEKLGDDEDLEDRVDALGGFDHLFGEFAKTQNKASEEALEKAKGELRRDWNLKLSTVVTMKLKLDGLLRKVRDKREQQRLREQQQRLLERVVRKVDVVTDRQIKEMLAAIDFFNLIDDDHNGTITEREVFKLFSGGINYHDLTAEQEQIIIEKTINFLGTYDKDSDNEVSFEEFLDVQLIKPKA